MQLTQRAYFRGNAIKKPQLLFLLKIFAILAIPIAVLTYKVVAIMYFSPKQIISSAVQQQLKAFTLEDLKKYNGTDPNLPIYMGYDHHVYDVTAGADKFYKKGQDYNYLVGKNSTLELDAVGMGGLIQHKYPLVGKLVK